MGSFSSNDFIILNCLGIAFRLTTRNQFYLNMVSSLQRMLALGCAGLLAIPAISATQSNLDGLLHNSPFGSAQGEQIDKNSTPLEFRGVMAEGNTYFFSIYAQADSRSEWLQLEEKSAKNYVVRSYDSSRQELTLEYQGQSMTLALTSAAGPTGAQRASSQVSVQRPVTNSTLVQPATPVNDAARLGKIAQEIKRRRALRQKAIAGN